MAASLRQPALAWFRAAIWFALMLCALPSSAQGIESVLRPGDVIRGHAKWEDDCAQCHIRFNRDAQNGQCMDCHKDVGADVRGRAGYHGRIKPQPCRACHTDHKGRDARIVDLDTRSFDHQQTDYVLRGKHAPVECSKCHVPGKQYREAPQTCSACHQKDDVHKNSLGAACGDCHSEVDWKKTRFDHAKTRFALTGKHIDAKCTDCHKTAIYNEAPLACIACHRKDDDSAKGHRGRFGEKCESCHSTKGWKPGVFNHDTETKYPLRGKHREATCVSCHKGWLYRDKLTTGCVDCHRADDQHKGSLGNDCQACHVETRWSETRRFDHARTQFPLRGQHADAKCADCHQSAKDGKPESYKVADSTCVACHRKDDTHKPSLGNQCQSCHVERGWKDLAAFDHDKARFTLRGGHVNVKCAACHRTPDYRATSNTCIACHRKDDKHEGQLGERCESCHRDTRWTDTRFDHARARFALVGRHVRVECKSCHDSLRYRDAPRDCIDCHRKDDKHMARFGVACESCHNARDWRIWTFDHDRKTSFVLDGAHKPVACEGCHTTPAPQVKTIGEIGSTCLSCHRKDDKHDGAFGPRCDQCHYTTDWKRVRGRTGATSLNELPVRRGLGQSSWFARLASRRPS